MSVSRQRIFEYIRSHRVATASDVARSLATTDANARRHMLILESQGLVQVIGLRPKDGRGRPSKLYSVSERYLGNNFAMVTCVLMNLYLGSSSGKKRDKAIQKLVLNLIKSTDGEKVVAKAKNIKSITQRLSQIISILNSMNYQARWEAHVDAPHIIFGHCPYAAILHNHPEFCEVDKLLLEMMSDLRIDQREKLAIDSRGVKYCLFAVI